MASPFNTGVPCGLSELCDATEMSGFNRNKS